MTEAGWDVEATEPLKDGEDLRIGEAKRGDPLRSQPEGLLQRIQRITLQRAVMAHAFDREQGAVVARAMTRAGVTWHCGTAASRCRRTAPEWTSPLVAKWHSSGREGSHDRRGRALSGRPPARRIRAH